LSKHKVLIAVAETKYKVIIYKNGVLNQAGNANSGNVILSGKRGGKRRRFEIGSLVGHKVCNRLFKAVDGELEHRENLAYH